MSQKVTIIGTSYDGCHGEINRDFANGMIEVYMPPQPTADGREIKRGTSWLFTDDQIKR